MLSLIIPGIHKSLLFSLTIASVALLGSLLKLVRQMKNTFWNTGSDWSFYVFSFKENLCPMQLISFFGSIKFLQFLYFPNFVWWSTYWREEISRIWFNRSLCVCVIFVFHQKLVYFIGNSFCMPKMSFQNLSTLELEAIKMHYSSIPNVYNTKNILSLWKCNLYYLPRFTNHEYC